MRGNTPAKTPLNRKPTTERKILRIFRTENHSSDNYEKGNYNEQRIDSFHNLLTFK